MFGQRLDIETHIVMAAEAAIQNLTQCVEAAGVQVEGLVLASLASAEAVLEEEEKQQGVVLADIGGGTTGIAVFTAGTVFHTSVLPVGGYHLTHDLVAGVRAPFSVMEEAKIVYGSALPSRVDPEEMVELEAFGGQQLKTVSRRRIAEILQARVEEILEMIYMDVKRAGFDEMIAAGLVLTGGTASLPGIDELAEQVLRMPVRIGRARGVHGLADTLNSPAYAASVGLLRWALQENGHNGHKPLAFKAPFELKGLWDNVRKWLKTLMPQ
jgi:cell division protein FtsA